MPDPKAVRQALRFGCGILGLLFVVVLILGGAVPYTELLWFQHDARHPEVFATAYGTRGWLFIFGWLGSWGVLWFSLRRALHISLVFLRAPQNAGQLLISNAMGFVQEKGKEVVRFASPLVAFFTAITFSNSWNEYLLFRHPESFGVKDPVFGIDVSFFVFTLPWYQAVANYVFTTFFIATALTVAVYAGLQTMAALAKIELGRPAIRGHIGVLLAATFFTYGLQCWLRTYDVGLTTSEQFTGAGYSAMQAMLTTRVFAVIVMLVGLACLVNLRFWKPYSAALAGGVASATWYGLAVIAYPTIVQKLMVDPDRLTKEAPYAAKAIKMTRFAYGLDQIETKDVNPSIQPTQKEVSESQATLDNMRLWDPTILQSALDGLQGIRLYYKFNNVDVDRYKIDGKQTLVMLATRDLNLDGLDQSARNWTNERLKFTHGYGVVMSRVDRATDDGQPVLLSENIPNQQTKDVPPFEPRIYFADTRSDSGALVDEYSIVDTGEPEFDYKAGNDTAVHTWKGDRGVPMGWLSRIAFSIVLGDGNLLVSPRVSANSKLLVHRNVIDRATRIYPFLKFDGDPYIVLVGGRVMWVLDGYTTTDNVPYSCMASESGESINYIRNSVKVTIDAYSGEINGYSVDETDPLLKAYSKIYPTLLKKSFQMPTGLREHLRYPDDIFTLQCMVLSVYHVDGPATFLSNSDAWDLALQRGVHGQREPIKPFYVQMKLPDGNSEEFMQILPFTPRQKINMSGWVAVHCDPERYGKISLYRFAQGTPIAGPEQMETKFNTTPEIANMNKLFQSDQSKIMVGNLLVIPIGNSVMYVEPIFLQSATAGLQSVPRLSRVILGLNDKVVVGDSYAQALSELFGKIDKLSNPVQKKPYIKNKLISVSELNEVVSIMDQAELALKSGDLGKYGELQSRARILLKQLVSNN